MEPVETVSTIDTPVVTPGDDLPPSLQGLMESKSLAHQAVHVASSGEELYLIEKVLEFHPRRGYLCHWLGFPESDRTWQRSRDMPLQCADEMRRVRNAYYELHPVEARRRDISKTPVVASESTSEVLSQKISTSAQPQGAVNDPRAGLQNILLYKPGRGYLVELSGTKTLKWLLQREIPPAFSQEMRTARAAHQSSLPKGNSKTEEIKKNKRKYEIEDVHEYDPDKGFLVSWKGYPVSSNSWQAEPDMPSAFSDRMAELKVRNHSSTEPREIPNSKRICSTNRAILHSILKYDPRRGFLVHWRGCPDYMDSWIPESEISEGYRYQAQLARERHQDNQ